MTLAPINFGYSSSSGVTSAELSRSPTPTIKYHEHDENYLEGFDYTSPNRLEYNDLDNFFYQNEGEYPMCNDNLFGN